MSGVRSEENVIVFIIFFQKRIKATNTDSKKSQTIKKCRIQKNIWSNVTKLGAGMFTVVNLHEYSQSLKVISITPK